jgi:PPOX class probable F420-dependent enzyme
MNAITAPDAARASRFLESEAVLWLATVGSTGTPALVPVWFWWDGEAVLVASKPDARKVRNIRANPRVMLALGDADADFDVGLIEARAELVEVPAQAVLAAGLERKYRGRMAAIGLTVDEFAATYRQVIRIVPTRPLAWRGRSRPGDWPLPAPARWMVWLGRALNVLGLGDERAAPPVTAS